jgi:hypothetical protein
MPLTFAETLVRFEGVCCVEEALPLLEHCRNTKAPEVDLSDCTYLHTALLQVLLLARPLVTVLPADPFLARWLAPLFAQPTGVARAGRTPLVDRDTRAGPGVAGGDDATTFHASDTG